MRDTGGSVDPLMRRARDRSGVVSCERMNSSRPEKIAGAPLATVTSSSTKAWAIAPMSSAEKRPGSTSFAPAPAAACGKPHDRTWNMGVIGMMTSV